MANISFNKNYDIAKVVKRVVYTVLALYVGGTIMTTFGTVMNCTSSPFYEGLTLIGWTITDSVTINATGSACNAASTGLVAGTLYNNLVTSVSGSGVLAVIGIIGIASVVMEFISFK